MDGGNGLLLALQFFGFAGVTMALVVHQLWALKKLELKRRNREEADEAEAASAG
jgi:hypothetical protein